MLSGLLCPICRNELFKVENRICCNKNHSFDISAEGYINLAIRKSGSGDSKSMCRARRDFLSAGYYYSFAEKITDIIESCKLNTDAVICDAGCGEGYYLRNIKNKFPDYKYIGFDLAKDSIKFAAKAEKNSDSAITYAVAGIFNMPIKSDSCSAVLSVFAPVPVNEAYRVLVNNGFLIIAHPGEKHLSGLKKQLYDNPYDNIEKKLYCDGFDFLSDTRCSYSVHINKKDMQNLLLMTPYYWKTSRNDVDKLLKLDGFDTELDFIISVFVKNKSKDI